MQRTIRIDPSVEHVVVLGLVRARCTTVPAPGGPLDAELERDVALLRERHAGATAGQIAHLAAARELYRAIGLDPTKRRPSPEALLRRLLRGDAFPRVHPAVDLANLWAVRHGLPVGLYDLTRVHGTIALRLGREDESYGGIRKADVHLAGRLVLADERGPFGNPSSDSERTSVDDTSRELLFVLFAPAGYDRENIAHWLAWLDERLRAWFGAAVETEMT